MRPGRVPVMRPGRVPRYAPGEGARYAPGEGAPLCAPAPAAEAATKAVAVTIHLMRDRENTGPPRTASNY
jgi:hypothetical protein